MDKTFEKFLRRGIDLSPVGVMRREDNAGYFCTPRGASIFGWAGVDGIHFCFIRGFGGMVFSVSPMNTAPHYVHPLSRSFEDFLRLLLSCGDVAALEQAWMWDEAEFDAFLRDNPPTEEQRQVLSQVAKRLNLTPMERPWSYIKELQSSFDYAKIKYTEDFYDEDMNPNIEPQMPEWKVYFGGSFWGHSGRDRAGAEISLNKEFTWAGRRWLVPAAYSCSKGLVLDFCMQVEPEDIRRFTEKWDLSPENAFYERFTQEQQMELKLDDPFSLNFAPLLEVNGKPLRPSHGCGLSFNPCIPEGYKNDLEAKWVVEHYGLDASCGWFITRSAFPWNRKRRPEVKTLSLTMEQQPSQVPGPHFKARRPGDTFAFTHPVSGIEYTLTAQEIEPKTIPAGAFRSKDWLFPTNAVAMSYTLSPEPEEDISVRDCDDGDRPLKIAPSPPISPTATASAAVIGVIGGADGPIVVTLGNARQAKLRAVYSSLHFEPVEGDVEWRLEFNVTRFEKASFALIG